MTKWLVRLLGAVGGGAVGGAVGGVFGWVFITIWTVVFSRVPLKHAWDYTQREASQALFTLGVVAAGALVGLICGAAWGARVAVRWRERGRPRRPGQENAAPGPGRRAG
ncbi:hypothetical protein LCGC14_2900990 [marine sediment metagenome]|uniref:Uncharacterized protein n=1 Tax=marine sediment metagenome TaxID=412755 RepID=A0A0F9AKJ8_9ZZZZ